MSDSATVDLRGIQSVGPPTSSAGPGAAPLLVVRPVAYPEVACGDGRDDCVAQMRLGAHEPVSLDSGTLPVEQEGRGAAAQRRSAVRVKRLPDPARINEGSKAVESCRRDLVAHRQVVLVRHKKTSPQTAWTRFSCPRASTSD